MDPMPDAMPDIGLLSPESVLLWLLVTLRCFPILIDYWDRCSVTTWQYHRARALVEYTAPYLPDGEKHWRSLFFMVEPEELLPWACEHMPGLRKWLDGLDNTPVIKRKVA
jgi:hypothetical protein